LSVTAHQPLRLGQRADGGRVVLDLRLAAGHVDEENGRAAPRDAATAGRDSRPGRAARHPLPEAPWFAPGERWSARRVLLHIMAETAHHAGHADIIRESLDGAKSMG
jgi:hypothetical protein